jgi:hypothetical protein
VAEEHLEPVEERRRENRLLRVGDLLLVMFEGRRRAGERCPAGAAVLVGLVLIGGADREGVLVADLMRDAAGDERSPVPPRNPSKMRFCSGGFVAAKAFRASSAESRKIRLPSP